MTIQTKKKQKGAPRKAKRWECTSTISILQRNCRNRNWYICLKNKKKKRKVRNLRKPCARTK